MGKKGRKTLAMTMEKILPKLDDAVILMYFVMLAKAFRPSKMPASSTFRSFLSSSTSAHSRTDSAAVSTEIPTSAAVMAGRSFMPSPKKPTVWPLSCKTCTMRIFCLGDSSAKTVQRSTQTGSSLSVSWSRASPVSTAVVSIPRRRQMDTATLFWSPVSTLLRTCSAFSLSIALAALALGASKKTR